MKFFKSLYIANLFYYLLLIVASLFVLSFYVKPLVTVANAAFWLWLTVMAWDLIFLYFSKNKVQIERHYPEKLSNGDPNPLSIEIKSSYPLPVRTRVLEELPMQLQIRKNEFNMVLKPQVSHRLDFEITPKMRGTYAFGVCNVLVQHLGFFARRFVLAEIRNIPCYPSFIQMRKYQLLATTDRLVEMGIKRIRRIGTTMEFDHIREYVQGDEYRHMNWKASAKHNKLLVNQYQEEKSQPIFSFIDTGRAMRMPFNEMTLLDYAINSTLVLSSAAILKQDRAGMLTFSTDVSNYIPA